MTNWFSRIHNGKNFKSSMTKHLWACKSGVSDGKHFISNAKDGDKLWFIYGAPWGGTIFAVATFVKTVKRELGPLISVTATNEDLGWLTSPTSMDWDVEIHFKDLYIIESLKILHGKKQQSSLMRIKDTDEQGVKLEQEYLNIVKYCDVHRLKPIV